MKGHPSLASRPELRSRKDLHHVVPISIHGDGVTYAKTMRASNESMEVLCWTSMLSSHATLLSSYLIICLVKSIIKTAFFGNTWQATWKIILWSLNALSSGLWPSQDWQGRQWPAQSRDAKSKHPTCKRLCSHTMEHQGRFRIFSTSFWSQALQQQSALFIVSGCKE